MHRLLLFGGAFIEGPDGPLAGRAAHGQRLALLALLAAEHPRPLTRDRLIACLWPQSDSERGRRLLRHALHLLRAALGKDAVHSHGDELRLDPARLDCDLWEFREALERGDREAAVAVYAGPFLHGVFLDDAEEFERWVEVERSRLASYFMEALEALAEQHEAAGELRAAAGAWRRLSEQDPYNSHFALRLMGALAAARDRAGALRHAEVHTALLQTDLGAEPDPDIETLAMRIRGPPSPREEAAGALPAPPPAEKPRSRGDDEPGIGGAGATRPEPVGATGAQPRDSPSAGSGVRGISSRFHPSTLLTAASVLLLLVGTLTFTVRDSVPTGVRNMLMLRIGPTESLLSRGALMERERVLLADFTSPTGDSLLARMATVAFRVDLSQSPVLTLVEPQQVHAALARMQRSDARILDPELAREIALREGIKAVLVGKIARGGGGYLLTAQLLATGSGEILVAHRETARDSTALLPALDRLSKQLRRRIGESLQSARSNPPLEQVTTSSLEALHRFSQARHALYMEEDYGRGVALLEEAVALDTAFAMAYRALAVALTNTGQQRARQVEMLGRAFRHRHRLTAREGYHLLQAYYTYHTWEPEKAITALRSLLDLHPQDVWALNNLGVNYRMVGDYARAEEFARRSLEVDSSKVLVVYNLITWQVNQGKLEEADSTYARLVRRFPEVLHASPAMQLAAAKGDLAGVERWVRAERAAKREDLYTQLFTARKLADLAAVHGRLHEAQRHADEASALSERRGLAGEHLLEAIHLAHLELTLGRPATRALRRVGQALERHPLSGMDVYDRPYADLAALHARTGQPALARALLAEWEQEAPLELHRLVGMQRARPYWGKALPWALGEIALAEGRPLEAAEHFRKANEGSCLICTLPHLGRTHEAAGQPDSAIAVYERYLRTPFVHRLDYDAEWRALVLERLGQLHEARGDRARAAEYYAQFSELWQDADPELQPRVRAARRRLAALGGE